MRPVRIVLSAGALLVVLFAVAVGLLWARQESLIFPVRHEGVPVAAGGIWQVGRLHVPGAGQLSFLFADGAGDPIGPAVLYLHGNGSAARFTATLMDRAARAGVPVLAAEYPGYSANPGAPTEASLRATAEAAAEWARARWPGRPLAVVGESIGSAPAVHLAATGRVDRLVLDSGFTSMTDTIRHHLRWLPAVGWLNRHPMDNLAALRAAAGPLPPTLLLVSSDDPVVPAAMADRLAEAIPASTVFRSARPGHPVLHGDPAALDALLAWLRRAGSLPSQARMG
ncbi:alpha/beta hydrolase [Muricoccus radiodurans]|uniref:alpha/beta hydrolase n=1 Tax=Muricoccus radiodurans TaxID=2231721 RepID=UPI003CEA509E